jgi:ATP-dependent DNA helicase PIF1
MTTIKIYTDGSCLGNPGPGGFGYVAIKETSILAEYSGHAMCTTNNKMELQAAIEALASIYGHEDSISSIPYTDDTLFELHTDSKYVKNGITDWVNKWRVNNWKNSKKEEVKNKELWVKLDALNQKLEGRVSWHWVKGHSGDVWNDYADKLAVEGAMVAKAEMEPKKKESGRDLTQSQQKALSFILDGKSVFITGPGGCGKTFLINYFVKKYRARKNIAVTSTTGTSAIHIRGTTIHSWAGIGLGRGSVYSIVTRIKKKKYLKEHWTGADILIIDEVSMLSPDLFDKLEQIAKTIRKSDEPFGGLQLIITGDFLQLPVINCDKFCFESMSWDSCIDETIYMRENLRQSDPSWQKCLDEVRIGEISPESKKLLKSCTKKKISKINKKADIKPTILFPLNADVEEINNNCLEEICQTSGEVLDYEMEVEIYDRRNKTVEIQVEKFKKNCPVGETLSLTVGCQVMLLWNMELENGLVNGSRGVVVKFMNDLPLVKFLDGQTRLIDYHLWELEDDDNKKIAGIEQIPLKLAYAISIHKSQGCSLDYVITDLSDVFEYGQAYVALSRVRTATGLFIKHLKFSKIKANPTAKAYYDALLKRDE